MTSETMKQYYEIHLGRRQTKYSVSFHDGQKTYPDDSPFYDMRLFSNRKRKDAFIKELARDGYTERSQA